MMKLKQQIAIILLAGIIALPFHSIGQTKLAEAFTITKNGSVIDIQPYKEALNKIDLEKYRLKDKRRILKFDTGVEVQLKSANELSGKTSNPPVYRDDRVFKLSKNGQIAEGVPTHNVKSAGKAQEYAVQKQLERTPAKTNSNEVNQLPAGFPKYVSTGDPAEDQRKYKADKEKWIQNNPDKYKQISSGSTVKQRVISVEEYNKMSEEKKQVIINNPDKYKVNKNRK